MNYSNLGKSINLNWKSALRVAIFVLVVLVILTLDLYYYYPAALPPNVTGHTLKAVESYSRILSEPNKSSIVTFDVTVLDGFSPYKFVASWPDNFSQQNSLGLFSRIFQQGQAIPQSVRVTVTDADNQKTSVEISISQSTSSATTSTLLSTTSSISIANSTVRVTSGVIEFVENGLAGGNAWSLTIDGKTMKSIGNELVFIGPFGNYSYSVSYSYTDISSVYSITPKMGTVIFNKSITIVNITFSQIPSDQLLTMVGKPTYEFTNGLLSVNSTFQSNLPISMNMIVFATLFDSSGRSVAVTSSSIFSRSGDTVLASFFFVSQAAGNYTIDIAAFTTNGTRISNTTAISLDLQS